jgi:hypothetical protein
MAAPLLQSVTDMFSAPETEYLPFEEDQPPVYPDRPKTGLFGVYLDVKTQWTLCVAFWVVLVAWVIAFCVDPFSGNMKFFVNNVVPILPFFFFAIPSSCSLIGYAPPKETLVCLLMILAGPLVFGMWQAALPYFAGYTCCIIMSFMFMAIHHGKAANEDEDGSGKTDFQLSMAQPALVAWSMALLYLWQFSIHCPLNNKLRWVMGVYGYGKQAVLMAKQQRDGTAPKYNEKEFRTYKLNDVQYIRIMCTRCMIILAMFSFARIWEEKWCPVQTVTIDGGLFTWGSYKLFPWNYTKEIPVCQW